MNGIQIYTFIVTAFLVISLFAESHRALNSPERDKTHYIKAANIIFSILILTPIVGRIFNWW